MSEERVERDERLAFPRTPVPPIWERWFLERTTIFPPEYVVAKLKAFERYV